MLLCRASVAAALLAALLTTLGYGRGEEGPIVPTIYGKIQGKYTDRAQVFTSVPYARPPTGLLRWKDPMTPFPWGGVMETVDDPPGCPQSVPCGLPLANLLCPSRISEDCLYLNVFTPLTAKAGSNLPVMVFFHGGNFLRGYSGGLLYDGQYIVNTTDTIVVTANYRLGAIGFLVYGREEDGLKGNFGFKDQRLALQWVQENIVNFGGDPGQVTIWGQSAGAVSVALHMTTIRSSGLFHQAILESDPFSITLKDLHDARDLGNKFAEQLGCGKDDLSCLYSKDITEIATAENAVLKKIIDVFHILEIFLQWTPIVDGTDIMDQPLKLFARGKAAEIPFIIGTTSQECVFFVYEGFPKPMPVLEYNAVIAGVFGLLHYEEIRDKYTPSSDSDTRPTASVLATDYTFICSTRFATKGFLNATSMPVWHYVFNHSLSFDGWGKNFSFCDGKSCHAVELPFVFNTASLGGFNFTEAEVALSYSMITYWTNFAHRGTPNSSGELETRKCTSGNESTSQQNADLLYWPAYKGSEVSQTMKFKTPENEVITNFHGETCDFWEKIGYNV